MLPPGKEERYSTDERLPQDDVNKRLSDIEAQLTDMAALMRKFVDPLFLRLYLFSSARHS